MSQLPRAGGLDCCFLAELNLLSSAVICSGITRPLPSMQAFGKPICAPVRPCRYRTDAGAVPPSRAVVGVCSRGEIVFLSQASLIDLLIEQGRVFCREKKKGAHRHPENLDVGLSLHKRRPARGCVWLGRTRFEVHLLYDVTTLTRCSRPFWALRKKLELRAKQSLDGSSIEIRRAVLGQLWAQLGMTGHSNHSTRNRVGGTPVIHYNHVV